MKLCQIVPSLEEKHGGPSKSIYAISDALARAGHSVDLLSTEAGRTDERTEGGLHVRVFARGRPERFCPSAGLRSALFASDADLIHHHSIWLRTLHYAHRHAKGANKRLVVSPRGMMSRWAWRHHAWRKKFAGTFVHPGALDAADGWHATSPEEAEEIRALGFTQPVCVAPNGVDAPSDTEIKTATAYWVAACPEVARRPVALFYSRFHQKKRLIELIDLWVEQGPRDWLLLLVGVPQEYSAVELEAYVSRMSGAGRVRCFSGIDRPPPYPIASLFLLPSHNENFGLVIAEAMAHAVPALVTDTTPWRQLNTDGRGWCVPWMDYGEALTLATTERPQCLRERGQRARDWVLREFSWDKSARILAEFYQHLSGGV